MKRILLFTLAALFLNVFCAEAQVPTKKVERPKKQPQKSLTREVRPTVVDSIIPLPEADRYKDLLRQEETALKNLYRQNPSKELQFLADTSYCWECWFRADTRFKNTPKEVEEYLKLLRSTKTLYQRTTLTPNNRQELVRRVQQIERSRDKIMPVDSLGRPRMDCQFMFYIANQVPVTIKVTKVKGSSANLSNVRICLAAASALSSCKSTDCIVNIGSKPPSSCNTNDIKCLKKTGKGKYVLEGGKTAQVDRGFYHVIIAEKVGNTEKALYYTTLEIKDGTTINYKLK